MKPNIKIVFIDWFKTLSSSLFFDTEETQSSIIKDLKHTLFIDNKHLLNPWMRGEITHKDIINAISHDIKNISKETILQSFQDSCSAMKFDDLEFIELINKIKLTGRKVVIATDNMDVFRLFTVPALKLELLFDDILSSHELGHLKNDTHNGKLLFFENYLRSENCKPDEVILFDDCIDTVNLCKSFGFNATEITSPIDLTNGLKGVLENPPILS